MHPVFKNGLKKFVRSVSNTRPGIRLIWISFIAPSADGRRTAAADRQPTAKKSCLQSKKRKKNKIKRNYRKNGKLSKNGEGVLCIFAQKPSPVFSNAYWLCACDAHTHSLTLSLTHAHTHTRTHTRRVEQDKSEKV